MKKLLLGLGSLASVIAPVAAVVSCGDDDKTPTNNTQQTTPSTDAQTPSTDAQTPVGHTLTTGQIFDMGVDKLQTIVEAYDGEAGHDDISTATIADFISTIDSSTLSAEDKENLKAFTYHCGEAALTWHTIKFASATLQDQQLTFAAMAWAGAGTTADEKKAAVKAMIHESDADVNATVESIVKKFAGEDSNFNAPMVQMSYTVDKANHHLVAGLAEGLADSAMGGRESVAYILSKGTTPWKIVDSSIKVELAADATQDALVAAIKTTIGYDATVTTDVEVVLNENSLFITLATGANDAAIKTAITDAITAEPTFAGCFETAASA